ncbi:hypothetical protein HYPSUDRAFT_467255 [Hypholoma sublateritium FD-334 SS-4]|uniref:Ty3 transposon capsid-like protein domain-containing protein n=1 Tax=Hypholoma sublateritium (strain FD-334 SS-4) TaxID=945553 RepID=A0A0D2KHF2_HYPSF|nr:hypothetical protein HYPSUDRAFT_467255 [Hypholoma sublateritium FD-334 SS-4]
MAEDKDDKGSPKINPPDIYDGNKRNFHRFWQQVQLYILASPKQFTLDAQKIAFVLSYLRKGDADSWAESFQMQKAAESSGSDTDLGKWSDFVTDITKAFKSEYAAKDALTDLSNLFLKKNTTAEDHIAQFKTLVVKAGLKEEKDLCAKFEQSLSPRLRRLISYRGDPKTLQAWYDAATTMDHTDRQLNESNQRFLAQHRAEPKQISNKPNLSTRYYNARKGQMADTRSTYTRSTPSTRLSNVQQNIIISIVFS